MRATPMMPGRTGSGMASMPLLRKNRSHPVTFGRSRSNEGAVTVFRSQRSIRAPISAEV